MKVLVIPEDPKLDQYVLKPVAEMIFATLGRSPRVTILFNPRLRGVAQALDATILAGIIADHPMNDLFLILVDRDGDQSRRERAAAREQEHSGKMLVGLAIEEIEIWMLAIHRDSLRFPWKEVRSEVQLKERFVTPFLRQRAPKLGPGKGRAWAMEGLGSHWRGVLRCCPELEELQQRIEDWLKSRPGRTP